VDRIIGDSLDSIPKDIFWPSVMSLLADIAIALDDRELCRELRQRLAPFSGQIASSGTGLICIGPIAHTLGRLAAADDNADLAIGYLELAIEMGTRIGAPPMVARAQYALASVLANSNDPDDHIRVTILLQETERIARERGMARLLSMIGASATTDARMQALSDR
jgi:hypothetical protein